MAQVPAPYWPLTHLYLFVLILASLLCMHPASPAPSSSLDLPAAASSSLPQSHSLPSPFSASPHPQAHSHRLAHHPRAMHSRMHASRESYSIHRERLNATANNMSPSHPASPSTLLSQYLEADHALQAHLKKMRAARRHLSARPQRPPSPNSSVILFYHGMQYWPHLRLDRAQESNKFTQELLSVGLRVLVTKNRALLPQADLIIGIDTPNVPEHFPPPKSLLPHQALVLLTLETVYFAAGIGTITRPLSTATTLANASAGSLDAKAGAKKFVKDASINRALVNTPSAATLTSLKHPTAPYHYLVSFSRTSDVVVDYSYVWRDTAGYTVLRNGRGGSVHNLAGHLNKGAYAAVFGGSHCEAEPRRSFYDALVANNVSLHFFGLCRQTPGIDPPVRNARGKMMALMSYPFCLAVENTLMTDYMTEKLPQCILSGSVPIYMGAPNFRDLLPDATIGTLVIDAVNVYADPSKLARHLKWMVDPSNADNPRAFPAIKRQLLSWLDGFTYSVTRFPRLATDFVAEGAHSWLSRLAHLHHRRKK